MGLHSHITRSRTKMLLVILVTIGVDLEKLTRPENSNRLSRYEFGLIEYGSYPSQPA